MLKRWGEELPTCLMRAAPCRGESDYGPKPIADQGGYNPPAMRLRVAPLAGVLAATLTTMPGRAQAPAAPPAGPLQADMSSQLVRTLDRAAATLDGVVGYIVTDLTTHERVAARLEREAFPT